LFDKVNRSPENIRNAACVAEYRHFAYFNLRKGLASADIGQKPEIEENNYDGPTSK
jgi:hypothetical protein